MVGSWGYIVYYGGRMPEYRRLYVPGGTVFLTVVTYRRLPLFSDLANVNRLREAMRTVLAEAPFSFEAAVVLPDHFHVLWTLPPGDTRYSKRIGRIKVEFTQALRGRNALPSDRSLSRAKHRESDVWQRRFIEHTIRDDDDFERHLNYIHYNPVKHGYVACAHAWPYSSFSKWVGRSVYAANWACSCNGKIWQPPDWQEIEEHAGE
jgi:putative transposase